ncbi:hypothetical protein EON81_27835 [bacterium]|nr:MAG: hypothetical protein EON81_27835 [bacterium]
MTMVIMRLTMGLAGCKGNSIDGKWNVSGAEGMLPGSTATYEFNGGQATMSLNLKNPQIGEAIINISGPYTVEGEKLKLGAQKLTVDDSKLTPMAKMAMSSPQAQAAMTKGLSENNEYTVKFDSSDQVLLTGKKGTATLTRVK